MGSTRLPKKMAMELDGAPLLKWVIEGVKSAKKIDEIIVCTSQEVQDDKIEEIASKSDVKVFRGSENDVLDRFLKASIENNVDTIIRVCADNPLVSGVVIDELIDFFENNKPDYSFNHVPKLNNFWPDGFGAEVFKTKTLKTINESDQVDKGHKEHVTSYIWENQDKFNLIGMPSPFDKEYEKVKLDIDTKEDYEKINDFIKKLKLKFDDQKRFDVEYICEEYLKYEHRR